MAALALATAAMATPTVDGTTTSNNSVGTSIATSYGTGLHATDFCYALFCSVGKLELTSKCTASNTPWSCCTGSGTGTCTPSSWTEQLSDVDNLVSVLTHSYSGGGDTAPTLTTASSGPWTYNLRCYAGSNATFRVAPTAQINGSATTVQGPGITGTNGDAHLFDGCLFSASSSAFSSYNDSLNQEVTATMTDTSTFGSDAAITSTGPMTKAQNTANHSGGSVGIEADLEAALTIVSVSSSFGNGGSVSGSRAVQIARANSFGDGGAITPSRTVQLARTGSFGHGGAVSPSRTVQLARSSTFGDGGTITPSRAVQLAPSSSFGDGGSVVPSRTVQLTRSSSFGGGGIIAAGRAVAVFVSNVIHTAGAILGSLVTVAPASRPPVIVVMPITAVAVQGVPMSAVTVQVAPIAGAAIATVPVAWW